MGYVLGICGIVLGASVLFAILYVFFIRRYDLDDVALNSREDRKYGNVELDYDYDDEDRVEAFQDMIDFAKKVEDEEFDATVEEINKFVARRIDNNVNETVDELTMTIDEVSEEVPVVEQVVTPVQEIEEVRTFIPNQVNEVHVVTPEVPQVQVVEQPVMVQPQVVTAAPVQTSLYDDINTDDDYVEEL